jgi:hypothetical protein
MKQICWAVQYLINLKGTAPMLPILFEQNAEFQYVTASGTYWNIGFIGLITVEQLRENHEQPTWRNMDSAWINSNTSRSNKKKLSFLYSNKNTMKKG